MTNGIYDTSLVKTIMGQRLREAREEIKLSRDKFSQLLNTFSDRPITNGKQEEMNVERLKQWEYGNNPIAVEWLPLLCRALNCDVGYLFGEYEEKHREAADIRKTTGLTEDAISALKTIRQYNQTDWILDALNTILSEDDFLTLLLYIVKYETSGDKEAELLGQGESGKYSLRDIYQMKIFDILSRILTAISPKFENRKDYRTFYRTILSCYRTPDKNGKYRSLDEFRLEIENAGLEFDPALFEGGRENG